jgi:hypothetical protein
VSNVFQGTKFNVTKKIHDDCAPYSIEVHCMTHCINDLEFYVNLIKFAFDETH